MMYPEADPFLGLRPPALWSHFKRITTIPRPSRHEDRIRRDIDAWALRQGFRTRTDRVGNLCVSVPATSGRELAPVVVLQAHMDMVCERDPTSPYDPASGRIKVERFHDQGDELWLRANGTTLGADNGIGLASIMAIADTSGVAHGPLELLFTVEEETALTGAANLSPTFLTGRILLNLDGEDDSVVYVGSAGGSDVYLTACGGWDPVPLGMMSRQVLLAGLTGGHSGLDIDKGRANAIRCLARALMDVGRKIPLRLAALNAGNATNAIPREAAATILVHDEDTNALEETVRGAEKALNEQYKSTELGISLTLEAVDPVPRAAMTGEATQNILELLMALPSGPKSLSRALERTVETSANLATAHTLHDRMVFGISARSLNDAELDSILKRIRDIAAKHGLSAGPDVDRYPSWEPRFPSTALDVVRLAFIRQQTIPKITAVHAGLECGFIRRQISDMDMVSFGPDIRGVHGPGERVRVASVMQFWKILVEALNVLSQGAMSRSARHRVLTG